VRELNQVLAEKREGLADAPDTVSSSGRRDEKKRNSNEPPKLALRETVSANKSCAPDLALLRAKSMNAAHIAKSSSAK